MLLYSQALKACSMIRRASTLIKGLRCDVLAYVRVVRGTGRRGHPDYAFRGSFKQSLRFTVTATGFESKEAVPCMVL